MVLDGSTDAERARQAAGAFGATVVLEMTTNVSRRIDVVLVSWVSVNHRAAPIVTAAISSFEEPVQGTCSPRVPLLERCSATGR